MDIKHAELFRSSTGRCKGSAATHLSASRFMMGLCLALSGFAAEASWAQRVPAIPPPTSIDQQYQPGSDSRAQQGVPRGQVFEFTIDGSRIFPGTIRTIKVYVPAQYREDHPACVYVELDDFRFQTTTVFDNLINRHEMPITVAISISPGRVGSPDPNENPRYNRSNEFDSLNGDLARFVLEEVFPAVERHITSDGRHVRLSRDPNDHAAGGGSTGAIAAFTLAWQRPDAFRRVFSAVGTYVGMRGGETYPVLIRKTEPQPIRIFLQDGTNDQLDTFIGEAGNWWQGNQAMESALRFAGYSVEHVWGEGSHNHAHAIAIFPDAMRWLWRDWPAPVTAGVSRNVTLQDILLPSENWHPIPGNYGGATGLAVTRIGKVVFFDPQFRQSWEIAQGRAARSGALRQVFESAAPTPGGGIYLADPRHSLVRRYDAAGRVERSFRGHKVTELIAPDDRFAYALEQGDHDLGGSLRLLERDGSTRLLDRGLNHPRGLAISPDHQWLVVAEAHSHWGYSYRVGPDGALSARQRFYRFEVPDDADDSGVGQLAVDVEGRLYAATHLGVQVFDRNGRSRAILRVPGGAPTALTFGGTDFSTLYVAGGDGRIYARRLKVAGAPAWGAPIALPAWTPG